MQSTMSGYGPPTSETPGDIGATYMDLDTLKIYKCVRVGSEPEDYGFIAVRHNDGGLRTWVEDERSKTIRFKDMSYYFAGGARVDDEHVLDTSETTNFSHVCANWDKSVYELPANIDTSKGVDFGYAFMNCRKITKLPLNLDVRNGQELASMFVNCESMQTYPDLDTSNAIDMQYMFQGNRDLRIAPSMDTSNVLLVPSMFERCVSLHTVPTMDLNKCVTTNNMFKDCAQLKNIDLRNIRVSTQLSDGSTWGHLLTVDSLVNTIKELCKVENKQILTIGSENLAKIADLRCKVIDDTTEKISMELCDSTDDGSMTLVEYAALKNWDVN